MQNREQEAHDKLGKSNVYHKFVRTLGETQPSYLQESESTHIQISQPPQKVAQHSLVSSKSDLV